MRVGVGYDVHALIEGRPLIIGGVDIPYEKGLMGHSDADVLTHAVMDALLGAAAMGDIGQHFPDTDERYLGADSLLLLQKVFCKLETSGYRVGNIDAVVIAQAPKLVQYLPEMAQNIAKVLKISPTQINIKATTTEHLGFEGRKEGIAAQAVCLLESN